MNEDLLQYIWQHKFLLNQKLISTDGEALLILKTGQLNKDAGPDFFHAQINIAETLWAGNVEVHIRSSDWFKHKHQDDAAYSNVILHVVWENDADIFNQLGEKLPTLELNNLLDERLINTYQNLMQNQASIPCTQIFVKPPSTILSMWFERLLIERLEQRNKAILTQLKQANGNWDGVWFRQVAICFGQKTNALPFELLTGLLPYSLWLKYATQTMSQHALVLGIAGFLNHQVSDPYNQSLKREFQYLKNKHELQTMEPSVWKFGKTRPANFPTIRLLQFASFIGSKKNSLSNLLTCKTLQEGRAQLIQANEQMADIGDLHPNQKQSHLEKLRISTNLLHSILLNALIPVMHTHAQYHQLDGMGEKYLDWFFEIEAEQNHLTRDWAKLGLVVKKAGESQALIQLKNYYCTDNRCLECAIGNHLLKKELPLVALS